MSAKSFEKVAYNIRPNKQVERRMLLEGFQDLARANFSISDYVYVGFGSIYFVDFIMLHKWLGIEKLISVEWDQDIKRRVEFNRPFGNVEVKVQPFGDLVAEMNLEEQYIVWLDFDFRIAASMLQDIVSVMSKLSATSLILITVDVEPPDEGGPKEWKEHFESEAKDFLSTTHSASSYAQSKLHERNAEVLTNAISRGLAGRDVQYQQLFKFLYADGHRMLTLGGMVCREQDRRELRGSKLVERWYCVQDGNAEPYGIKVPNVTPKERLFLDSAMPCPDGWKPKQFELKDTEIEEYRKVYRYYPIYAELLLG